MNTPVVLLGIDWSELRNQKRTLIVVINKLEEGFSTGDVLGNRNSIISDLQGILNLIDSLQDYAVDVMGIQAIHIYDFELEDERDAETPEERFARENAQIIFEMRIEGEGLYVDDEMSKEFIQSIVDDSMHAVAIKNIIRHSILNDVKADPNDFERDENGKLTYDYTMYDYGYAIENYCREIHHMKNGRKIIKKLYKA